MRHAISHATRRVAGLLLALLAFACGLPDAGTGTATPDRGAQASSQPMASGSDAAVGVRDDAHPTDPSHAAVHAPARGLWILAEGSYRVLDDPARIEPLLERATRLAATDLFVQVYRGGRAFYHAGPGIERAPGHEPGTPDTLGLLIEQAHARGLRVHAWVNVLSLSKRADAALIGDLGPEALLVDRFGRSLIDYPDFEVPEPDRRYYRMGTPGLYLDPGSLAVRERVVTTFRDLLERQSGLDGLHLDYIRHPDVLPLIPGSRFGVGLDFGYGAESRARYRAETGQPDPIEGAPPGVVRSATAWDDWRRDQVSRLVSEIAATSRATRPDIVVSAAVIAYVDRAYLTLAQDWRGWLEAGWLDLAMPMVYTLDDRLLRYQMESFAGWPLAARIWPGVGVWLFGGSPEGARTQLAILRRGRFAGEMLFSDDAIASSPELLAALVETPEGVAPPAPSTPSPSTPAP